MALGFFRRRQKLVLVVMVLLMVAFLLPSAFQRLGGKTGLDEAVGHVGQDKITVRMRRVAEVDLRLLQRSLGLGFSGKPRLGETEFRIFMAANAARDPTLTWTLLLHEARGMGIKITESQIDAFLADSGLSGEAYDREVATLRESKYTAKDLRRAVANFLTVMTAFQAAAVRTPPSLPQLRHTFRDIQERIGLAMAAFEAEEFLAEAPKPSEKQIIEHFDRYKHLGRRDPSNRTEFGFGYRRPDEVDVAWLFIDRNIVARTVEPPERQMMEYWRRHKGELKRKVLIPTTSTSSAPAETQPAETQPAEPKFREVVIEKYSRAKPQIRRILRDQAVEARMIEIVSLARRAAEPFAKADEPYSEAVGAMMRPADDLLGRKVAALPFTKAPLETVIEQLEDSAKVKIVYPFGEHDKISLDEKIVVEIDPWNNISLGEALERIGKKAKFPPIKWVACDGFEEAIFPSEPVNLVPVSAGRTGVVGFEEIRDHELLGWAGPDKVPAGDDIGRPRQDLLSMVMTASVFQAVGRKHASQIEVGGEFDQATYVSGTRTGQMIWRLVGAEAAHMPRHLTDEIRRQIVRDLKIVAAFEAARASAEAMKAEVDEKGAALEEIAKASNRRSEKTELFSRKRVSFQTGQMFWSNVPGIGQDVGFIETAFRLVPADPDGPHTGRPTAVVRLYRQHKVVLVQRIAYEPVTALIFENWGVYSAGAIVANQRWSRTVMTWFAGASVAKRVGYSPMQ